MIDPMLVFALLASGFAQEAAMPRFASAIDAFVASDRTAPPPQKGILFIGSSIFRQWETVAKDMSPLPAFNRAFGGSRTADILTHMDRIVLPYEPKVIVYYCGSNDINADIAPVTIAANFRTFAERVHAKLPQTKLLYVSINRAPQKRSRWPDVDQANRLIEEYTKSDPRLKFVDVNPALFDAKGEPRMELYRVDKLHFKIPAYREFTRIIRPAVEAAWR
jgi:hypothetical protein